MVSERVIDFFEAVKVKHEQGHRLMLWLTACGGDRLAEPIMEQDAIRQVRQRIVQGLVVEARLGGPRLFEEAHLFDRRGGVPNEQLHDLEVARGKRRIRAAGDIEDTHGPALDPC